MRAKLNTKALTSKRDNSYSQLSEANLNKASDIFADKLLFLQRNMGNQEVNGLIDTVSMQTKIGFGQYKNNNKRVKNSFEDRSLDKALVNNYLNIGFQEAGLYLQRQSTSEESSMSVLRAIFLEAIVNARATSRNRERREELNQLENNIGTLDRNQLRQAISSLRVEAREGTAGIVSGKQRITPSSAPSALDPLQDNPDQVIQESRNNHLYQLIQLLTTSSSFAARNIRLMVGQMNTTLNDIEWYAYSEGVFGAATSLNGTTGSPPAAQIEIVLGGPMLVLMNYPSDDMLPTLYHEIYHAYERFRLQTRGALSERTNLSRDEMERRVGQLAGSAFEEDAQHRSDAISFARGLESELYAELLEHSAMQDPNVSRARSVALSRHLVTLNSPSRTEAKVSLYLEQIHLIFGEQEGRRIVTELQQRANSEGLVHQATLQMFNSMVDHEFP